MKQVLYNGYGSADRLIMQDVAIPTVHGNTVLVKVKAVSINPLDWKIFNGEMKLMSGRKFPKGVGIDFSGSIVNIGSKVRNFKTGDEVFGNMDVFKGAALSEFITVAEDAIYKTPAGLSHQQAAALPVAGSAALQILDKLINVSAGTSILINGATGGIGMFVLQLAKAKAAVLTAVTNSAGLPYAKKWGASSVVDYKTEDVFKSNKKYDVLIDLSGKMSFQKGKQLLKPAGTFVNTVPGPKEIVGSFLHNLFSKRKYKILLLKPSQVYLKRLAELVNTGLDINIHRTYVFGDVVHAYKESAKGGIIGKSVINVG